MGKICQEKFDQKSIYRWKKAREKLFKIINHLGKCKL